MSRSPLGKFLVVFACCGIAAGATYDLAADWSNTGQTNRPWSYNSGTFVLPLIASWNGANTTWSSSCNQAAWAPSNNSGQFVPAWLQVNSCAESYFPTDPNNAPVKNVRAGDVIVHTNDSASGNVSQGAANVVFTLPQSSASGLYKISGALWAARLSTVGSRPQDWQVTVNGTAIASGTVTGTVSRSSAQTFSVTQRLNLGDRVQLTVSKAATSTFGDFVGVQLTIASSTPVISPNGVVSASAFGGFPLVAPGTWIEIYGSSLATATRSWSGDDFTGLNAPTSLDGTTVTIGGKAAFVDYISPRQVNALVPSDTPSGPQQLVVSTSAGGASPPFPVAVNAVEPGILSPPTFTIAGTQYAVAVLTDGALALPVGAIAGVNSRPATPGEAIILYGIGFGSVVPESPAGQLVQRLNNLASAFQVTIGGTPASVAYAGLAPNYTGLYQFNVIVPAVLPGAAALKFTLGTAAGSQTLAIAVRN